MLLLITVGGLAGYDWLFSGKTDRKNAVAEIVGFQGDVRVKYTDELAWQTSRGKQKLAYDDSVFSGPNSSVDLRLGSSEIKLDANTLVVIRKDRNFSSLNLTYGNIGGTLAKGDHLVIESAAGEKFELKGTESSKINVSRQQGKIVLKVLEGNAQLMKDGKVQSLSSRDEVQFANNEKVEMNSLVFTSPKFSVRYAYTESEEVEFTWQHTRPDTDAGSFLFEMSDSPSFKTITMREESTEPNITAPVHFPMDVYYRVKDSRGNHSETRRLTLLTPQPPNILEPQESAAFESEPGQNFTANVTITAPTLESKANVQIARDPEFQQVVAVKTGVESKYSFDLPVGRYFARARLEYRQINRDLSPMTSPWSEARRFSIYEKLDLDRLSQLKLIKKIVVENKQYSPALYKDEARAKEFLATQEPFKKYFGDLIRPGHELVMRNSHQPALRQTNFGFPAEWIKPGVITFNYQLEAGGHVTMPLKSQTVRVEMAPPVDLQHRGEGHLQWSPILFAKSYQIEVRGQGDSKSYTSRVNGLKTQVNPGQKYAFRVRALGENAEPISDWSKAQSFAPEITIPPLAENSESSRVLASEETATSSLKLSKEKTLFRRAMAWLWAGTGVNFLAVRQTINNTADVEYKNTKGGSVFLEGGWWFGRNWGAAVSYKRTPGDIRVDNHPINQRSFTWDTYTAELLYALPWTFHVFGREVGYGLRGGVQKHAFPFLFVDTGNTLVQTQSEMTAASLGFFAETAGRWRLHLNMRYQQPIASSTAGGNTFDIKPIVGFDGLVGTSYLLTKRLKTGVFWYGQLHDYNFTYKSPTQTNQGTQSLFYSNWEMRMGLDF